MYILLCDQKMYYVGITNGVKKRMMDHKFKQSFFTKKFSDIKLVYAEIHNNKYEAAKREKQIKGRSAAKKKMLVNGDIGYNTCTEIVERLLEQDENLVSLLRA